ncbi:MAG: Hsp20/alpha crystallin family protein [Minisyncoccales bacterium]|jgi:HSP20 family protein
MRIIPWRNDDFFDDDWVPTTSLKEAALNLYETDDEIVAEIGTIGVDPENIEVLIGEEYIEVKGESQREEEEKEKNYWKKEIYKGSFEKVIKIPPNIDKDKIEAVDGKGTLKIIMPKKDEKKSEKKKIEIKKS